MTFAALLMNIEPPHIEYLDLSNCGITDEVYHDLAIAAAKCRTLRVINLKSNEIHGASISSLLAASEEHQSVFGRAFIPTRYAASEEVSLTTITNYFPQEKEHELGISRPAAVRSFAAPRYPAHKR